MNAANKTGAVGWFFHVRWVGNSLRPAVVALAGQIGSGKTSVATCLASALACPIASFGVYVRNVATRTKGKDSREILQETSERLMTSVGPYGLTREVLSLSGWDRKRSLVVDGVRHSQVVTALKAEVAPSPMMLVYLDVSPELRRQRLASRDNLSAAALEAFDLHSTERDVGTQVRALADMVLNSDARVEDLVEIVISAIYSL